MEGGDRIDLYYFGVGKMVGWCTKVRFEIYKKVKKREAYRTGTLY